VECRSWVAQKRFALVMLLALTLLLAASVAVPIVESAALAGSEDLPWGLDELGAIRTAIVVVGGFIITFGIVSSIYWAVPKGHMPWRSVWPGALFFSAAVSIANYVFPVYLTTVSDLDRIGGAIGFILVALIWFYAVSLGMLAGAVINSLRHERDDTGTLPTDG
jgi:membrane protein